MFSLRPEDPPHLEDMNKQQLQKEIKKEIDEIGKKDEVFVIIIDAVNQVTMAYMGCPWDIIGLENAALGLRPRAAFSRPLAQL